MKNIFIALLITITIGFVVILVQMFTRETTLDSARTLSFNLVCDFIDADAQISSSKLKTALNTLSSDGKVLFPIALLRENECIDNAFICEKIKSFNEFETYLSKQDVLVINAHNYVNHSSKFFIYEKLKNQNAYLIGHAGKYIFADESELSKFIYFLGNDFNDLLTTETGREKLWKKSRYMWLVIFIISGILSYMYIKRKRKNLARFKDLKILQRKQQQEWEEALTKQIEIENELQAKEDELSSMELKSEQDSSREIQELQKSKDELHVRLQDSKKSLNTLEKKEASLIKTILSQSKRLAAKDASKVNEDTYNELTNLKKLWRVEPLWHERITIESGVTTDIKRTPFTITQAFISFDNFILQKAKRAGYKSRENEDLYGAINFLHENNFLNGTEKNIFHKIRIKRNDWFHLGVYPNKIIIKEVLKYLELQHQKPIL